MLYKDKLDWILPKINGEKVLDLGCVRHEISETEKEHWLHALIAERASTVLGVDYLEDEVNKLNKKGFNMVCDNVETMSLDDQFDIIVAGDIIEHLNNFGNFLERVGEHLTPDGRFILTTPNPVNPMRFFKVLFSGKAGANPEHTCWFTEQVLVQLANRYGFWPKEIAYVNDSKQYYTKLKWKPFLLVNYIFCKFRNSFSETLCVEFKKRT